MGLWFDPLKGEVATERPPYLWDPPEGRSFQQQCEAIARWWTLNGRESTWRDVWEQSPNGELFMIPRQYDNALYGLANDKRLTVNERAFWDAELVNRFGPNRDGIDPAKV